MENNNISRKDFLKVVGATAAVSAVALSGCKSDTIEKETTYSVGDIPKDKMTYRVNHNTGDKVSILGYGMMRLPDQAGSPADFGAGPNVSSRSFSA